MDYRKVVVAAVQDIALHGYDSPERIARWAEAIASSARDTLAPERDLERQLTQVLEQVYRRQVGQRQLLKSHFGAEGFALDRAQYVLRRELEKRLLVAAELVKSNRDLAIKETVRRFQGWATSLPEGGRKLDRGDAAAAILKYLKNLPSADRRIILDQGRKLASGLSQALAISGNAVGGYWSSKWRQPGYDFREDHRDRDLEFFLLRDNWAITQGFMKLGGHKYTSSITAPGEEPNCQCHYRWVYSLSGVPEACLTKKGIVAVRGDRE